MIIFVTSRWGIGLSTDSAGYLASTKNILNGKGLSVLYDSQGIPLTTWLPMTDNETLHLNPWPPFLPLILSIFGLMKLNLLVVSRYLNALLFGANIFLVTFIVKKHLKSTFLVVFTAIVLIISKDMIQIHSMLWSEPLFIFLTLMGFVFLISFLEKNKILFLLLASLFFSLAFFTRIIGITFAALIAITVSLYSGLKIKNKIIYTVLSIFITILPFSIWALTNKIIYNNPTAEFIFHPFPIKYYTRILATISLWVIPNKAPEKVRVILMAILIVIIIAVAFYIAFKNRNKAINEYYELNSKITNIFLFFILFYFITLLFGRYFLDESIVINENRILLPVVLVIFMVFLFILKRFLDFFSNEENIKILIYFFCGLLLAAALYNNNAISLFNNGHFYSRNDWYQSETIKELRKIPLTQTIYTNEPAVIYLFLGRSSMYLPIKYNIHTGRSNTDYEKDIDKIIKEIKEKDGLLIFFDRGYGVFPKEEELKNKYKLDLIKDTSDGAIYRIGY